MKLNAVEEPTLTLHRSATLTYVVVIDGSTRHNDAGSGRTALDVAGPHSVAWPEFNPKSPSSPARAVPLELNTRLRRD
jgi:hypothetical protein